MTGALIEVPATSANLGPGFDSLGLALDIVDTVTAEYDAAGGETVLHAPDAPDIDPRDNLLCRAYSAWGTDTGKELPAARFTLERRIPVARGFGSSAAAIVAGLAAARHAAGVKDDLERELRLAAAIEGHADNTTAALLGGLTVALRDGEGVRALHVANHFSFGVALFVPQAPLRTAEARAALPATVPHGDAAFNLGRVAYLVTALLWGRWEEIGVAMDDRLHQPYRAGLIPALSAVLDAAREAGAYGAALSGGGPSVIALCPRESTGAIAGAMEARAGEEGWPGEAIVTAVRHLGVTVKPVTSPV